MHEVRAGGGQVLQCMHGGGFVLITGVCRAIRVLWLTKLKRGEAGCRGADGRQMHEHCYMHEHCVVHLIVERRRQHVIDRPGLAGEVRSDDMEEL